MKNRRKNGDYYWVRAKMMVDGKPRSYMSCASPTDATGGMPAEADDPWREARGQQLLAACRTRPGCATSQAAAFSLTQRWRCWCVPPLPVGLGRARTLAAQAVALLGLSAFLLWRFQAVLPGRWWTPSV